MVDALGGGPVIVRNGGPMFRSNEGFTTDQLLPRNPRTGVGQLADGRIILRRRRRPRSRLQRRDDELRARAGAGAARRRDGVGARRRRLVDDGLRGQAPQPPSDPGGERAVKESLNVFYYGVYAARRRARTLSPNGDGIDETHRLAYKIVRPSAVTAQLVGPDGTTITLDARPARSDDGLPGPLNSRHVLLHLDGLDPTTGLSAPRESWHLDVAATDDLAARRQSRAVLAQQHARASRRAGPAPPAAEGSHGDRRASASSYAAQRLGPDRDAARHGHPGPSAAPVATGHARSWSGTAAPAHQGQAARPLRPLLAHWSRRTGSARRNWQRPSPCGGSPPKPKPDEALTSVLRPDRPRSSALGTTGSTPSSC